MRSRAVWLALLMLGSIGLAQQGEEPANHRVLAAQFTVAYPPGDGWKATIEGPGIFQMGFPFDDVEENVKFTREPETEGEPEYIYLLSVRRLWPGTDECSIRPQDSRNPLEALQQLDEFYERAEKEGTNKKFIFDLQECGKSTAGYAEIRLDYEGFYARENAMMMGETRAAIVDEGTTVAGDRTIYFARFEIGESSMSKRWEMATYLYFPPGFGKQDLFFFEASLIAECNSRQGCTELGDTTAPPLAVLASLEPRLIEEQLADSEFASVKLTAEDGEEDHNFGGSVDIDGDTVAVVADGNRRFRGKSGSVYVFTRDATSGRWRERAKLVVNDVKVHDLLLGSVAISGDTIVVGSNRSAYVFIRDAVTGRWNQQANLGVSGDAVAIDGNTIVIGDFLFNRSSEGVAYVFERDTTTGDWIRQATLAPSDPTLGRFFGHFVALDGDTVVVADVGKKDPDSPYIGDTPGSAYIFIRDPLTERWNQRARLVASEPDPGESFGSAVAIDGDTVLVGARGPFMSRELSGSADVFVRDRATGQWQHQQRLTSEDTVTGNTFGNSVAIDGDMIAIGAVHDTDPRDDSGAVYVYYRDATTSQWIKQTKLKAPDIAVDDNFGETVALQGSLLVVGSPNDDDRGNDSGSVYVFALRAKNSEPDQSVEPVD